MFLKIIKGFLLFILLVAIALVFLFQLNDFYKKYLISLIEIPKLKIENSEKTTFLKIYSKNGNLIFHQYNNFGGLINLKNDFENFDELYNFFLKTNGKDIYLEQIFEKFYKKYKNKVFGLTYKKFLKEQFYKAFLEKYSYSDFYTIIANNFVFQKKIKGVNGYSFYLFGTDFENLKLKERTFLILLVLFNNSDAHKNFAYFEKLASLFAEDETPIRFNYPKTVVKYNDYVEGVLKELKEYNLDYKRNNIVVYSNLDETLYKVMKRIVASSLKKYDGVEGSTVILNYKTKRVLAVLGNINGDYALNRALYAKREVGSVFKPVTYLTAFSYGLRPSFVLEDKPYAFKEGSFIYKPKNFKDFYMGRTNIRNGLIYSLNNLTIKLAEAVGLKRVSKMANKLGFENVKPFYAMPLGSIPQTPFTVANAFSAIANYGYRCKMKFIYKIEINDKEFDIADEKCQKVVDEKSAYQTIYLMKKVVQYGTARGANLIPGTSGKTGTSNDSKDCWFVGIFPPYVVVQWVGYDNYKTIDEDATGGKVAAPIVAKIEKYLLKNVKRVSFDVPKGVVLRKVVKNEDMLYSDGCGRYYYEMLKLNNLPKRCDKINTAEKE